MHLHYKEFLLSRDVIHAFQGIFEHWPFPSIIIIYILRDNLKLFYADVRRGISRWLKQRNVKVIQTSNGLSIETTKDIQRLDDKIGESVNQKIEKEINQQAGEGVQLELPVQEDSLTEVKEQLNNISQQLFITQKSLFFERISKRILDWQLEILLIGQIHESIQLKILSEEVMSKFLKYELTHESIFQTILALKDLEFITIVKSPSGDELIGFTPLSKEFVNYLGYN